MSAIDKLAQLARLPQLPRALGQMTAIEKSIVLVSAHADAAALVNAKLPRPPWVVSIALQGGAVDAQQSVYDQLNSQANQIIQSVAQGGSPQINLAISEFNDAIWSGFLGAEYAITPLSNAIAAGENHDAEFVERVAVLQAISIIVTQTTPLLQTGILNPLRSGIDAMWQSVCSDPSNRSHPQCVQRGLSGPLGAAPLILIALGIAAIAALAYVAIKWYELKQFNDRWLQRCKDPKDAATIKWCNETGAPPKALDPNELAKTVAIIAAVGIFAYAGIMFLPQIIGRVSSAKRAAREA